MEAEIVSGPGTGSRTGCTDARPDGPVPAFGLFRRIRSLLTALGLLLAFALIFLGFILTSTIIGAVIGIPLILLGGVCFWLVFKFMTLGRKNGSVIFRRF